MSTLVLLLVLLNSKGCNQCHHTSKSFSEDCVFTSVEVIGEPRLELFCDILCERPHINHEKHLLPGPGAHLDYTGPGRFWKGDSRKMNEELRAATAAVTELRRRALYNKRAAGDPRHPGIARPGLETPYQAADQEARGLTLALKYLEKEAWRQESREIKRTAVRLADRALDIAICFGLLGLATLGIAAVCVTLNAPDMVTQATALVGVGTALGRAVTRK